MSELGKGCLHCTQQDRNFTSNKATYF